MSTVNEKMTAIADQIRTLIGTTGAMGLDAMATNLMTANSAVASAKTAITDKGVSVPDGAGVDDLAALIASIICPDVSKVTAAAGNVLAGKVFVDANGNAVTGTMTNQGAVSTTVEAGGTYTIPAGYHNGSGKVTGAASSGYQVVTGTKSTTSIGTSISISHGLGVKPVYAFIILASDITSSSKTLYSSMAYCNGSTHAVWSSGNSTAQNYYGKGKNNHTVTVSDSTVTFTCGTSYATSNNQLNFGAGTYRYVIVG